MFRDVKRKVGVYNIKNVHIYNNNLLYLNYMCINLLTELSQEAAYGSTFLFITY